MSKYTIVLCTGWSVLSTASVFGQDLVPSSELSRIEYYKYWQAHLPLRPDEEILQTHLVEESLYAITSQANLYALHADIGTLRWSTNLGGPGTHVFKPTHVRSFWGRDLTLVATSGGVYWIERSSGERVFQINGDFIPSTPAVSDGVRLYVGGLDAMLHCIELAPEADGVAAIRKWRIRMKALSSTSPVLWGGGLFFASHDGRIRACDSYDKTRFWVFRSATPIRADMYVDSTGVYWGSTDHHVYKLDVNTGRPSWRFRTSGVIHRQPVLIGDSLYQVVEKAGAYAIGTETGEQLWHTPTAKAFISASDEGVYLLSSSGDILAIDRETGRIDGRIHAGRVDLVASNAASSAMYLLGRNGTVLCAQDMRVPYLRFEEVQARHEGHAASRTLPTSTPQDSNPSDRPALIDLLRSKSDATASGNED